MEIVASFPGTPSKGSQPRAAYDWPQMAKLNEDGSAPINRLVKGIDFEAKVTSALQRAKAWATKNGRTLNYQVEGDVLFVQFEVDPNAAKPAESAATPAAPAVSTGNPFVQ